MAQGGAHRRVRKGFSIWAFLRARHEGIWPIYFSGLGATAFVIGALAALLMGLAPDGAGNALLVVALPAVVVSILDMLISSVAEPVSRRHARRRRATRDSPQPSDPVS